MSHVKSPEFCADPLKETNPHLKLAGSALFPHHGAFTSPNFSATATWVLHLFLSLSNQATMSPPPDIPTHLPPPGPLCTVPERGLEAASRDASRDKGLDWLQLLPRHNGISGGNRL